jgi:hypothetical protein
MSLLLPTLGSPYLSQKIIQILNLGQEDGAKSLSVKHGTPDDKVKSQLDRMISLGIGTKPCM